MTRRALIEVRGISKHFGREKAVNDVSLDIYDKEFLVLLGPSGCGKTTLLRLIGGFENPTEGVIRMDGRDIAALPPNKRPVNMVFQSYAVFPHMNVRDNIAYGLRIDRVAAPELKRRVDEAVSLVQLDGLETRFSHQLSGGQRQRVALARALVKRPRLLLLDEPLSALDAKLRETMQNELVKLHNTVGITFVVVTHDQDEALSMAERVAVMESGGIRQLDTPRNLYEAPSSRFVADFVGRMNILPARAAGDGRYAVDGLGEIAAASGGGARARIFRRDSPGKTAHRRPRRRALRRRRALGRSRRGKRLVLRRADRAERLRRRRRQPHRRHPQQQPQRSRPLGRRTRHGLVAGGGCDFVGGITTRAKSR